LGGCGVYGASVGLWRSPLQGVFTAIKVPLLILLTCAGNAVLNGMFAQALGSRFSFREASMAILLSFALAAVVLASLTPLTLFVLLNAPPPDSDSRATAHGAILVLHVLIIAYAGILANYRLLGILRHYSPSRGIAFTTLAAWLAGNLLLGTQLSWVLRPFIGSPGLSVEFLRDDPLRGNFFEAVWHAFNRIT
jgi:hypothetical protein